MYSIQVSADSAETPLPHSSFFSFSLDLEFWVSAWCHSLPSFFSQSQHSHLVIQQLLGHLDANSKNSATVRAGIVEVLLEAAAIAASGSVGEVTFTYRYTVTLYVNTIMYRL